MRVSWLWLAPVSWAEAVRILAGLSLVLLLPYLGEAMAQSIRPDAAPAVVVQPESVERKIALVIGNSGYIHLDRLPNAVNDADAVAETLQHSGFKVILLRDVDRKTFEANLRFFAAEADGSDIAVVYYSGHGFQVGGENFLVPVDAALAQPADMEIQTVRLAEVMDLVSQRARTRIFILDSCRNSPFLEGQYWFRDSLASATGAGLAEVRSSLNTLVAFSTEPGAVAFDGTGDTSPFSGAFARYARIPNQEVRSVLSAVRRAVVAETGGRQVPWENSSLVDDVFFLRRATAPIIAPVIETVVSASRDPMVLGLPIPVSPDGSRIQVQIERAPGRGELFLDGERIELGSIIDGADLGRLSFSASAPPAGDADLDLLAFAARSEWGGQTRSVVALRLVGAEGAERLETYRSARLAAVRAADAAAGRYRAEVDARRIEIPIGVGPIPLGLPDAPAEARGVAVRIAAPIHSGLLRLGDRALGLDASLLAEELSALTFEPQIGSSGDVDLRMLFKIGDGADVSLSLILRPKLLACDEKAAELLDLQGVAPGRYNYQIDQAALDACVAAVAAYPDVPRLLYQRGRGKLATGDVAGSIADFEAATDAGHIRGLSRLGSIFATGSGLPIDMPRANFFYAQAAALGDPGGLTAWGRALFHGTGTEPDPAKGLDYLLRSASLGSTNAMNDLAGIFLLGKNGVPKAEARGIAFLEAAIARDDLAAINNLGVAKLNGYGVEPDPAAAIDLFDRATDLGDPQAPTNLGRMYLQGVGVRQDAARAVELFELASRRGDPNGAIERAVVELNRGRDGDPAVAAEYLALAVALDFRSEYPKVLAALRDMSKADVRTALKRVIARQVVKTKTSKDPVEDLVRATRRVWEEGDPRLDLL